MLFLGYFKYVHVIIVGFMNEPLMREMLSFESLMDEKNVKAMQFLQSWQKISS